MAVDGPRAGRIFRPELRRLASASGSRRGCKLLAPEPLLDLCRAAVLVPVEILAVHAPDALVRVDVTVGVDALHRAFLGAALAGGAALRMPLEPGEEHRQTRRNGEGRAERAEIAAEEPLDEQADHEQGHREEHEWPGAHELERDRGL